MKKIYLSLFTFCAFGVSNAQTLTLAANQPVVGDVQNMKKYDSTSVVPKSTGAGQTWNFGSFATTTITSSSTFTNPSGVPNNSVFVGATLAEDQGGGNYNFWKATATPTTQYELLGMSGGGLNFYYSNSAIAAVWPIAFGYSVTDTYSGNVSGVGSGTLTGTITTLGSATGTLTLPGGAVFSNVLQTKTHNTVYIGLTTPAPVTATTIGTDYNYYHASQKFPLLTVSYQATSGYTNYSTADINVNNAVFAGLTEKNFDATFQIFPNPAKDAFHVDLSNAGNDNGSIEIFNSAGQLTRTISLGNESAIKKNISIEGMVPGIYLVKTKLGDRTSTRKLVIE